MIIVPVGASWGLGPSLLYLFGVIAVFVWFILDTNRLYEDKNVLRRIDKDNEQRNKRRMYEEKTKVKLSEDEINKRFLESLKQDAKDRFVKEKWNEYS